MKSSELVEKKSSHLEDVFAVRSDKLKELRDLVRSWKSFQNALGEAAQFRLVVDTNIVLGDILWLAIERKNEKARTDFMEVIEAETIDVYAPPSLLEEVEEKIPLLAAEKGADKNKMYAEWSRYKARIRIIEPDSEKVNILKNGVDPDDASFVALAQTIAAAGVISKDRHIAMMGGNQISIECITHLRNYSRATAIELNIKVNGVQFAAIGFAAARGLFVGIKSLIDGISKAPSWVKVGLVAGGLLIAIHPQTRASINRVLRTILAGVSDATPTVISFIAEASSLAEEHRAKAQLQLEKAMKELHRGDVMP